MGEQIVKFIQEKIIKMKGKGGQLKIQEMSFMLLGLVLFFIIAGLFFLIISNAGLRQDAETLERVC